MTSGNGRETVSALSAQSPTLTSAEQDRITVQAALAGDQSAFADLVTRYQSAVYNMAYRMLGDPTEAEDAAQEVFVRAWNQLRTFQIERRFSTWLLSIASHHCIDMLRRRKPTAPIDDVALFVPSEDPEPDELALRGERRDMVQRLLNTLPEKYRTVTVLRYYNDLSYDEIARTTGLTESAVKTQLHRARRMLADQLVAAGVVSSEEATAQSTKFHKGGEPK
jgi:RNA polymerase sigma-70 factor (ECF subfamily)